MMLSALAGVGSDAVISHGDVLIITNNDDAIGDTCSSIDSLSSATEIE